MGLTPPADDTPNAGAPAIGDNYYEVGGHLEYFNNAKQGAYGNW